MTKIWQQSGFVSDDAWGVLAENDNFTPISDEDGNSADLSSVKAISVQPADDVTELDGKLDNIEIIALNFPAFNDGRAFSHATILREHLGYKGEIRAYGHILLDQVPFMLRCGFTSFEVSDEATIKYLGKNHIPGIDHHYQPSARPSAHANSFSWRRMAQAE